MQAQREIRVGGLARGIEPEARKLVVRLALARGMVFVAQAARCAFEQRRDPCSLVETLRLEAVCRFATVASLGLVCLDRHRRKPAPSLERAPSIALVGEENHARRISMKFD